MLLYESFGINSRVLNENLAGKELAVKEFALKRKYADLYAEKFDDVTLILQSKQLFD